MRSVKYLFAAGAASFMSSVAFAADMPMIQPPPQPYYAPPQQDFGSWYLRGDIGFSNQRVNNVRSTNAALYQGLNTFSETTNFDSAGTYQVGAGYQFNSWFRADITGEYRGSANFKGTDLVTFPFAGAVASGINNYSASKTELLFLANVYADLGTWWCVTPFIGAGVGTARVSINNFTDNGLTNQQVGGGGVPAFVGGPPVASAVSAANGSEWNFAWALHAGLAYKISPNATLELAYSYVNMGNGTTGVDSAFDGSVGGHVFKFNNITSNDVKLGVRWNFDSAPAYAPPPLVTKG